MVPGSDEAGREPGRAVEAPPPTPGPWGAAAVPGRDVRRHGGGRSHPGASATLAAAGTRLPAHLGGRLRRLRRPGRAARRLEPPPVGPLRPDQRLRHVQPGLEPDRHRPPRPVRDDVPLQLPALRLPVLAEPPRADDVAARPAPGRGRQRLLPPRRAGPRRRRPRPGRPPHRARDARAELAPHRRRRNRRRCRAPRRPPAVPLDLLGRLVRLPLPAARRLLPRTLRTGRVERPTEGLVVAGRGAAVRGRRRLLPRRPRLRRGARRPVHPPHGLALHGRRGRLDRVRRGHRVGQGVEPRRQLRLPGAPERVHRAPRHGRRAGGHRHPPVRGRVGAPQPLEPDLQVHRRFGHHRGRLAPRVRARARGARPERSATSPPCSSAPRRPSRTSWPPPS